MKETRELGVILAEVESTMEMVADGLPMYKHWLYTGLPLPRRDALPPKMDDAISMDSVIERKVEAWNRYIDSGDIATAVTVLVERPFRLYKFLDWVNTAGDTIDPATFVETVRDLWIDSEFPHVNYHVWRGLWRKVFDSAHHHDIYTISELNQREMLDEPFTIYRGVAVNEDPPGLSWTTDRDRAEWFARRWQGMGGGSPRVYSREVDIMQVVGPLHQRGEAEFILLRPHRFLTGNPRVEVLHEK